MKRTPRNPRIRIVSLPRMQRLKLDPAERFRSDLRIYVGTFTEMENKFKHHLNGGASMYRQWIASELENQSSKVRMTIGRIWHHYHYSESPNPTVFLLHDEELPPLHAKIIYDFVVSGGTRL